jgi:hypothetical protein
MNARTNAKGHAIINKAPSGVELFVRVKLPSEKAGEDGKEITSSKFSMPSEGGVRVLLTSKPLRTKEGASQGGQSAAPMQDPRKLSGTPRPESADAAGTLTVRAIRGKFSDSEGRAPVGAQVHLIGYGSGGRVEKTTKVVDQGERVSFENLATDGSMSYYALSVFERNGIEDRLTSQAISMPPKTGMRMLLAGLNAKATEPGVDDLGKTQNMEAPAAGLVFIRLAGDAMAAAQVELVEIGRPDVVAKAPVTDPPPPGGESVIGAAQSPKADPALGAGVIAVEVIRTSKRQPLAQQIVRILKEDGSEVTRGVTDGAGSVQLKGLTPGRYVVELDAFGKKIKSEVVELADQGLGVAFGVDWTPSQGSRAAAFSGVASGPDHVYLARVDVGGHIFRSQPFQLTKDKGAAVILNGFSRLLFGFHGNAEVDDARLWVSGFQLIIANLGEEPFDPGPEGLKIPLPQGFVGASVDEKWTSKVGVEKGKGLIWRGVFPPGQKAIGVAFALDIEDGGADINWYFPNGLERGSLVFERSPGLRIEGPQNAQRRERDMNGRVFTIIGDIFERPGETLAMKVRGLPQPPTWRRYAAGAAGIVVMALFGWGLFGLFSGRDENEASRARKELEEKRERLFARLVDLEKQMRAGKSSSKLDKQRAKLKKDLEGVYRELDE